MQRSALLIAALATGTTSAFPAALEDRLHQPYRYPLVPGLEEMVKLRAPGLLGCALSGAGPSILVFYERGSEQVCDLVRQIFALHGHKSETLVRAHRAPRLPTDQLDSSPVSPQINVQARRKPEPFALGDLGQPAPSLGQNRRIHAFRHQHHAASAALRSRSTIALTCVQIARIGDHKLELIRIELDQPPQDLRLIAQALVLIGPAPAVARRAASNWRASD